MEILNPKFTKEEKKWRAKARCAGLDTSEFFPEIGVNIQHIKTFCYECPVMVECGNFAIDNNILDGVWGGLSYRERRDIRMGRRPRLDAAVRD